MCISDINSSRMATMNTTLSNILEGAMGLLRLVLCFPFFIVKRVRKWSHLEEEQFEEEIGGMNRLDVTTPSWNNHQIGTVEVSDEAVSPPVEPCVNGSELPKSTPPSNTPGAVFDEVCRTDNDGTLAVDDKVATEAVDYHVPKDLQRTTADGASPSTPPSPFVVATTVLKLSDSPNFAATSSHSSEHTGRLSSPPLGSKKKKACRRIAIPVTPGPEASRQLANCFTPNQSIIRSRSAPSTAFKLEEDKTSDQIDKESSKESTVAASKNARKENQESSSPGLIISCCAANDIGLRRSMEDFHITATAEDDDVLCKCPCIKAVAAVFDGHNGSEAAEFARDNFLRLLCDGCCGCFDISTKLRSTFFQCEADLHEQWMEGTLGDSGTTALVVVVSETHLHIANAGDCRAVLCRAGRAEAITKDHRPGSPEERARIVDSGGFLDSDCYLNGEIGVSRALGDFHLDSIKKLGGVCPLIPDPDLHELELTDDCEFLVIGSDGLWDVLSNQRAVDIARTHLNETKSAVRAAEKLVFEAKCKDSRDNITAGLVVLRKLPLPVRKPVRKRFTNSRLHLSSRSLMDLKQALVAAESDSPNGHPQI